MLTKLGLRVIPYITTNIFGELQGMWYELRSLRTWGIKLKTGKVDRCFDREVSPTPPVDAHESIKWKTMPSDNSIVSHNLRTTLAVDGNHFFAMQQSFDERRCIAFDHRHVESSGGDATAENAEIRRGRTVYKNKA
jgi:hypothetical protein